MNCCNNHSAALYAGLLPCSAFSSAPFGEHQRAHVMSCAFMLHYVCIYDQLIGHYTWFLVHVTRSSL
jgi:hypothetical protein